MKKPQFIVIEKIDGDYAYIRMDAIAAIARKDGDTVIYLYGDPNPFRTHTPLEELTRVLNAVYNMK